MKRFIHTEVPETIGNNPRQDEYFAYLDKHIAGVNKAFGDILLPAVISNNRLLRFRVEDIMHASQVVQDHDESKYQVDEFIPYCNYFYPTEDFPKDEEAFDRAWLIHQHRNPHHWQHWILHRDSGEYTAMDMPTYYIMEMLCDWSSFHYTDPSSTANNWYRDNKDRMELSPRTTEIIEKLLELCPDL